VKESTIHREINELKTKIDNIKAKVIHDMENHRKENKKEIQTQRKTTPTD
jgi:hypothetical protein